MVYIPFAAGFASLLGLQAALEPLVLKQPVPETALITGVDYVDPRTGGGSLLDHDSGSGQGEPLNVSLSSLLALELKTQKYVGYHFRAQRSGGPLRQGLSALCERSRIVSI